MICISLGQHSLVKMSYCRTKSLRHIGYPSIWHIKYRFICRNIRLFFLRRCLVYLLLSSQSRMRPKNLGEKFFVTTWQCNIHPVNYCHPIERTNSLVFLHCILWKTQAKKAVMRTMLH